MKQKHRRGHDRSSGNGHELLITDVQLLRPTIFLNCLDRCRSSACGKPLTRVVFFSSRRRHTRSKRDWSSDVCSSDLYVIPGVALALMGGFALLYALIIKMTRGRVRADSQKIARESNNVIKNLQEGLGGIRDVLIDGSQESFCAIYQQTNRVLRRAQGNNQIISQGRSEERRVG